MTHCNNGFSMQSVNFDPISDLTDLFNQLRNSITELTESLDALSATVATLEPSYGNFYRIHQGAGVTETIAAGTAIPFITGPAIPGIGPNTSDITISNDGTTITIETAGVYQIDYNLLIYAISTGAAYWSRVGLNVIDPVTGAGYPPEGIQSNMISATDATVGECIPLVASFHLELAAGTQLQLVNLRPVNLVLCRGLGIDPGAEIGANVRINIERLSPKALV